MSQSELALLLGLLGGTFALSAALAWRGDDRPQDVALILAIGCTLGVAGALLHLF